MPRWVALTLVALLLISVGVNVVMAGLVARAWQDRPRPVMCRDGDLRAYSPGALVLVDGQLKRCKVAGIWVDRDERGNPLPDLAVPTSGPIPEG